MKRKRHNFKVNWMFTKGNIYAASHPTRIHWFSWSLVTFELLNGLCHIAIHQLYSVLNRCCCCCRRRRHSSFLRIHQTGCIFLYVPLSLVSVFLFFFLSRHFRTKRLNVPRWCATEECRYLWRFACFLLIFLFFFLSLSVSLPIFFRLVYHHADRNVCVLQCAIEQEDDFLFNVSVNFISFDINVRDSVRYFLLFAHQNNRRFNLINSMC